jgi:uncharacterized membrane protein
MTRTADADTRRAFLQSEEGLIFAIGCGMLLLAVAAIAALWRTGHAMWDDVLSVAFAHLLIGRGGSVVQGLQADVDRSVIVLIATYADIMALFLLYPVLVFSYENLIEHRFLQRHVKRVFDSARRNMGRMRHFKIAGVFLFVLFPFFMTGIVVGSVLGYLLGLRTWVTLITVSVAAFAAVAVTVYAYDIVFSLLSRVNASLPGMAGGLIIAFLIGYRIFQRRREARASAPPSSRRSPS